MAINFDRPRPAQWVFYWLFLDRLLSSLAVNFFMFFFSCRLLIYFQIQLFRKILSGIPSECQTDWIQIRPHILSGLIWVQSVCKGYEQAKLVGNELAS